MPLETVFSNSLEQGLLNSFMAMGVLLSFRLLGFPDLTVEGTDPLAAAITARLLVGGLDPALSTLGGIASGVIAGTATGLIHTKLKVNNILAGILVTSAIYTVMLRAMGRPNTPLLNQTTVMDEALKPFGLPSTAWPVVGFGVVLVLVAYLALNWFLHTDLGLAIRATGNNEQMIRALGADTDTTKVLTLAISNGLVAVSGALVAQDQGFADVGMGIGTLVAAVASIIIGETLFGSRTVSRHLAVIVAGSVLYRVLLNVALRLGLPASDFKAITAVLVLLALSAPLWKAARRPRAARLRRQQQREQERVPA